MNTAVAQMDKVTQANAKSTEECANASQGLTTQAGLLKTMVGDLVGVVTGKGGRGSRVSDAIRQSVRSAKDTLQAAMSTVSNAAANAGGPRLATAGGPGMSMPPPHNAPPRAAPQKVMKPSAVIPLGDGDFDEF